MCNVSAVITLAWRQENIKTAPPSTTRTSLEATEANMRHWEAFVLCLLECFVYFPISQKQQYNSKKLLSEKCFLSNFRVQSLEEGMTKDALNSETG